MIGRKIDRYTVVSKLGEGGMGTVWAAEDTLLDRTVALKTLHESLTASPEARQRFLREARAASKLDHPGIATVYDAGESDDLVYIAFQYIDGMTISDRVREGSVSVTRALEIITSAAKALGYAHGAGVLHRDVTSRNIMVAGDGRVMVVDFGLALPEGSTRLTQTGAVVGTAAYIAPEVWVGNPADQRSDLYGLGIVFYELITGRVPFESDRVETLMYACVNKPPSAPSAHRKDVPETIDRLVLRLLEKDPDKRHQSSDELLSEIARIDGNDAPVKKKSPSHPRANLRRRRLGLPELPGGLGRALAIGAVVIVALFVLLKSRTPGPNAPTGEPELLKAASLRILSAEPPAGTNLSTSELEQGIPVRVTVEHSIGSGPGVETDGFSPVLHLMVLVGKEKGGGDDWRLLAVRSGTWETRQLALTGTLEAKDVFEGQVTLRAVLGFEDSTGGLSFSYNSSTLLEFPVSAASPR